jgi:hypothetical protein
MTRDPRAPDIDDEELSAFLDGELDAAREAAVRAALAEDPALRARLEALGAVDEGLRALPGRPVPEDLHDRLRARIRADASPPARARGPRRRRLRWAPAVAAAAAAAVALLLLVGRPGPREAERIAEVPPASEGLPKVAEVPPASEGVPKVAEVPPEPEEAPRIVEAPAPEVEIADATDEELEVALEWETLQDLELLEHLEILEAMAAQEGRGRG